MPKILLIITALFSLQAVADGVMFNDNGRISDSKVTVLKLNAYQEEFIEYFFRCCRNKHNVETPYIFQLTEDQLDRLNQEASLSPARYLITSSYNGDMGMEMTMNSINRFRKDEIAIPHNYLENDAIADNYVKNIIGWEESRL